MIIGKAAFYQTSYSKLFSVMNWINSHSLIIFLEFNGQPIYLFKPTFLVQTNRWQDWFTIHKMPPPPPVTKWAIFNLLPITTVLIESIHLFHKHSLSHLPWNLTIIAYFVRWSFPYSLDLTIPFNIHLIDYPLNTQPPEIVWFPLLEMLSTSELLFLVTYQPQNFWSFSTDTLGICLRVCRIFGITVVG